MFAVIMAGGEGTRFWPRSRKNCPKQFLNIFGQGTMLQLAYNRIRPLLTPDKIFIVTLSDTYSKVIGQIPELPEENVIREPFGRNTAPCVGLAALILRKRQPEDVMVVLAADHLIRKEAEFQEIVQFASSVAKETDYVITLGLKPTHPETGYGYIQMGEILNFPGKFPIYRVLRFAEKPNPELAREFFQKGGFLWNSGMFIWEIDTLLNLIKNHSPALYRGLETIDAALGTSHEQEAIRKVYESLEAVSIDYALMEKAQKVVVIPCDLGWNDVGSWRSLADILVPDNDGNIVIGPFITKDSGNCIISSPDKLVAAIGLKEFIVVTSDDAILICPKDRHQEVREIVKYLKARQWEQYL